MGVLDKENLKSALRTVGLFPIARSAYRLFSGDFRRQYAHEVRFYSALLKPGSLCFDIGELGQKSEIFLSCGFRVLALEANPECEPTLRHLLGRNPNAKIVMSAAGSAPGELELHVQGTDAAVSVRPDWNKMIYGDGRPTKAHRVPVTTLDQLIADHGRPDFIQIDVEGFESDVLKGLTTRVPLVSLEFHSFEMQHTEESLQMLRRLGNLSIRPSTMHCEWLAERTSDLDTCLRTLRDKGVPGDLYVWID